jgi:taurine dioxygenase
LHRLSYALRAEIVGVNLAQPLPHELVKQMEAMIYEHHVVLFRDQNLTPAQHVRLTENFGEQEPYVFDYQQHPAFPQINVVTNQRENGLRPEAIDRGTEWHSDLSFSPRPAELSLLLCREAQDVGGNTIFANMVMAYERPSPNFRRVIDDAYAVHAMTAPLCNGLAARNDALFFDNLARQIAGRPLRNKIITRIAPAIARTSGDDTVPQSGEFAR